MTPYATCNHTPKLTLQHANVIKDELTALKVQHYLCYINTLK